MFLILSSNSYVFCLVYDETYCCIGSVFYLGFLGTIIVINHALFISIFFLFFSVFVKCGKFENKKTDQIENLF